jgi:hypothetical protein
MISKTVKKQSKKYKRYIKDFKRFQRNAIFFNIKLHILYKRWKNSQKNINDEKWDLMNITRFRKYLNVAKGANISVKIDIKFGYKYTRPHLISMHHFLF